MQGLRFEPRTSTYFLTTMLLDQKKHTIIRANHLKVKGKQDLVPPKGAYQYASSY